MPENQNREWKATWRDEYLKWICGFANAQGGVLEIGRDDAGRPVGVANAARLLEDLPNKIRDVLGIVPEVDLFREQGNELVRITVESFPYAVSYKGQYHYRSGSTKQELKGTALDHFLLRQTGRHWDAVPVPGVGVGDLDAREVQRFRERAVRSRRLGEEVLSEDDATLVSRSRLKEGDYLKRAAVLLFHPDPEAFVTGAYIKIGYFESDSDLRYHDEVHGSLFRQMDEAMDLLLTKYQKAWISYEGLQRLETLPVPEAALREALLNAVVHKDYASGIPIQVSVYEDRVLFWNNGRLPEHWTIDDLLAKHASQPFNPDVANAFFRSGAVEAWGRGIEKVMQACSDHGIAPPSLRYEHTGMWVEFAHSSMGNNTVSGETNSLSGIKLGLSRDQVSVLCKCSEEIGIRDLMVLVGRSNRTKFRDQVLRPLLDQGLVAMTVPGKPNSPAQRYRLTDRGRAIVASDHGEGSQG